MHTPVVGTKNRLARLGGLYKVVVWNLGEQVMDDVCSNVMVNFVEDSEVAVKRGQTSPQVAPLLTSTPQMHVS